MIAAMNDFLAKGHLPIELGRCGLHRQTARLVPAQFKPVSRLEMKLIEHILREDDDRSSPDRYQIDGGSAEHTSELQSLMRPSYAVFCLKKNTRHNHPQPTPIT